MTLEDIFEEIMEKGLHNLTEKSLLRKINYVRSNLYRNYKRKTTVSTLDLEADNALYPLPCPKGNIREVLVNGDSYKYNQLEGPGASKYYYVIGDSLGLEPTPEENVTEGLMIFHYDWPLKLTSDDWEADPVFDSDYDMLVVYGVLIDATAGDKYFEYKTKYDEMLGEFLKGNQDPEAAQIQVVEW